MQPADERSTPRDWLAVSLAQDARLARDLRAWQEWLSDDKPLHEAMSSLDRTLARVTDLAIEVQEFVDRTEVPRREPVSSRIVAVAAPALAAALGVYAVFFDKLTHPGIALGAVGLFFTKRALDSPRWRA